MGEWFRQASHGTIREGDWFITIHKVNENLVHFLDALIDSADLLLLKSLRPPVVASFRLSWGIRDPVKGIADHDLDFE